MKNFRTYLVPQLFPLTTRNRLNIQTAKISTRSYCSKVWPAAAGGSGPFNQMTAALRRAVLADLRTFLMTRLDFAFVVAFFARDF